MEGPVRFSTPDYVLLLLMLSISVAIGIYFAISTRHKKTRLEYLLGGRNMPALPVCLSLFATFQSAISLLGNPTEVYVYGTMKIYDVIGIILAYLVSLATALPLLYPLRLTSVNEYLYLRYNSIAVRLLGAVIGVVSTVSYMTTALLSPALALETVVGIPLWLSIVLVGAVGTIYTSIGGIKSVVWTDAFQSFVIFIGIFTVLVKACLDAGGLTKAWDEVEASGRLEFDNLSFDPRIRHTFWGLSFGSFWYWLSLQFSQSSVQRMVSIRSIRDARVAYIWSVPLNAFYCILLVLTGLVMVAYYRAVGCDPLEAGYVHNKNQLVPFLVVHTLRSLPGLSGLYISTIFSGALSTLSSGINSLAANTVEDFLIGPLRGKTEAAVTAVTKCLVFFFGALVIGLAYLAREFQGPVTQVNYTALGASAGPICGLFLLSGLFPQANYIGALAGCVSGLVISMWQAVGGRFYGRIIETLPPGPTDNCTRSNVTNVLQNIMTNYSASTTFVHNSTVLSQTYSSFTVSSAMPQIVDQTNSYGFWFYDLSYLWNPVIGITVTIVVGLLISLVTNRFIKDRESPEPKFIFPFCRKFFYSAKSEAVQLQSTTI